jgi:hypothetical protein
MIGLRRIGACERRELLEIVLGFREAVGRLGGASERVEAVWPFKSHADFDACSTSPATKRLRHDGAAVIS